MVRVNRDWISSIWQAIEAGHGIDWADFEWYALDGHNSIGMLTSAGPGPILRSVFRDLDAYLEVVEFFGQLPQKGRAEILVEHYGDVDDWRQAAEHGLYGFNYERGNQGLDGYRMIARPDEPLRIEEVPEWVGKWLRCVRLDQAGFRESANRVLDLTGKDLEWL